MEIDLSEIVNDPSMAQSFDILRQTGSFQLGGWKANEPQPIDAYGVITVATPKMLQMIPEGDRVGGEMAFISANEMYVTSEKRSGTSDVLTWRCEQYRVMHVAPWVDYGFFIAIAVRMINTSEAA